MRQAARLSNGGRGTRVKARKKVLSPCYFATLFRRSLWCTERNLSAQKPTAKAAALLSASEQRDSERRGKKGLTSAIFRSDHGTPLLPPGGCTAPRAEEAAKPSSAGLPRNVGIARTGFKGFQKKHHTGPLKAANKPKPSTKLPPAEGMMKGKATGFQKGHNSHIWRKNKAAVAAAVAAAAASPAAAEDKAEKTELVGLHPPPPAARGVPASQKQQEQKPPRPAPPQQPRQQLQPAAAKGKLAAASSTQVPRLPKGVPIPPYQSSSPAAAAAGTHPPLPKQQLPPAGTTKPPLPRPRAPAAAPTATGGVSRPTTAAATTTTTPPSTTFSGYAAAAAAGAASAGAAAAAKATAAAAASAFAGRSFRDLQDLCRARGKPVRAARQVVGQPARNPAFADHARLAFVHCLTELAASSRRQIHGSRDQLVMRLMTASPGPVRVAAAAAPRAAVPGIATEASLPAASFCYPTVAFNVARWLRQSL